MLFALALLTVCLFFAGLFSVFAVAALQAGSVVIALGTSALALLLVFSMVSIVWTSIRDKY